MAAWDVPAADRPVPPGIRVGESVALAALTVRPCPVPLPAPGAVTVWMLCPPPTAPVPDLFERVLDAGERARAGRLRRARDRRLFLLSHGLTRLVLAVWTGCDPAEISFAVSPTGKPFGVGNCPSFNLSQAGDCALLAVAAGGPVGVDVEPVRPLPEAAAMAARFFAPEEQRAYAACPLAGRDAAFLRLWTRKEAYLKALGCGLSRPPQAFAVSLDDPVRVVRPLPGAPTPGPRLCALPAPPGHVAALAGWFDRVVCRDLVLDHASRAAF